MQKIRVWLPISCLTAAVVATVALRVAWQASPPPARPTSMRPPSAAAALDGPADVPVALVQEYQANHIDVQTSPCLDGGGPDAYLFFDVEPDALRVWRLPQTPECADCWKGVILARFFPDRRLDEVILGTWGDCGMRSGPYLLFGDPTWISRSRGVLPQA